MQQLESKTLAELKALCREYSCFKGYSCYTKKADLIEFMVKRITALAEVTERSVLVSISGVPISMFVPAAVPTPEPVPFEEPEPQEEPDEWVDPDDRLVGEDGGEWTCPRCNNQQVWLLGKNGDVWRCPRCHAIGNTVDMVRASEETSLSNPRPLIHYCPDPDSKEYENKLSWWRKRARYALEQAAVKALKATRPGCICKDFNDLISSRLHREIQRADLSFSFRFYQALDKQIKAIYPFSSRLTPILTIWNEEGRKLLRELHDCVYTPLTRPNIRVRRFSKIHVPISEEDAIHLIHCLLVEKGMLVAAKDGEDDHRGGDPRRSEIECPDPANYRSYTSFKTDWEAWAATQEDEAEEEVAHTSALEVWWETYPDDTVKEAQQRESN